jgi:YVTN family beta-propeller protein
MQTVAVGANPVVPSPGDDGKVYVDCEDAKQISVFDPASASVALTYELGFTPGMANTAPARMEVWVTNSDDGKVVFDTVGQDRRLGELATGAGAHGIAFSSDGRTGYVTNQAAGTLSIIDVATHQLTATVQVGVKPNGVVYRADAVR